VFIDPPFEDPNEFAVLAAGLRRGHSRFSHGAFVAWYPIKQRGVSRSFHATMKATGITDILAVELYLREPVTADRLNGCGLLVINPPYQFAEQGNLIAAAVLNGLAHGETGTGTAIIRITDE
jgi:23S rRNA (adenine2030-N6)-methyltransferase